MNAPEKALALLEARLKSLEGDVGTIALLLAFFGLLGIISSIIAMSMAVPYSILMIFDSILLLTSILTFVSGALIARRVAERDEREERDGGGEEEEAPGMTARGTNGDQIIAGNEKLEVAGQTVSVGSLHGVVSPGIPAPEYHVEANEPLKCPICNAPRARGEDECPFCHKRFKK